jgi:hypothetical protein
VNQAQVCAVLAGELLVKLKDLLKAKDGQQGQGGNGNR